jgi:hypothetical protein
MPVLCSRCGEELLGAVNRCWRCGQPIVSRLGGDGEPPIRRAPIEGPLHAAPSGEAAIPEINAAAGSSGPVTAELSLPAPNDADSAEIAVFAAAAAPTTAAGGRAPATDAQRRKGSPFAAGAELMRVADLPPRDRYAESDLAQSRAAWAGVLAFFIGAFSALASVFAWWAVLAGLVGLPFGAWGLRSYRRGMAIAGLVLCCIGMTAGAFQAAVQLYILIKGTNPLGDPLW